MSVTEIVWSMDNSKIARLTARFPDASADVLCFVSVFDAVSVEDVGQMS